MSILDFPRRLVDTDEAYGMDYTTEHDDAGRLVSEVAVPADLQPVYLDDDSYDRSGR